MGNSNAVVLLSCLFSGCNEQERETLTNLYKQAFFSTEEYKKIEELLNDCLFGGKIGEDILKTGEIAIKSGATQPQNYLHSLTSMQYVISNTKKQLENTYEYLNSSSVENVDLSIIEKKDCETVRNFYLQMFEQICYLTVALYDVKMLENVKFNINASVLDMVRQTTNECRNIIEDLQKAPLPERWIIKRCNFQGANFVHYSGFTIEAWTEDIQFDEKNYKMISPFIYAPINDRNILCCGIGNVVVAENNITTLLSTTIDTSLPNGYLDGVDVDYNSFDPLSLLKQKAHNRAIVIKPTELVEHLNRCFMLQTVRERNVADVCAYCGSRNCSKKHFEIPQNFSIG